MNIPEEGSCMRKLKYEKPDELYTPEMILYELNGSLDLIPDHAEMLLGKSLSLLPKNVIDFIVGNYVFISQEEDEDGTHYAFDNIFFKDKIGFILLNNNLWRKKPIEIAFTIAHEVAHAFKRHTIKDFKDVDLDKGIKIEKEADRLALKWLNKHYKKESLEKLCNYLFRKKSDF